jgi:hypothetical protein
MEKDMVIMRLADIIQFIEETTGENGITQLEMSPVPFADENVYLTGFRLDTPNPMIHLKVIRKIRLFGAACSSKQQIEYYMMNPDAEMWIDFDALDAYTLKTAISDMTKKVYKSTGLVIMTVTYTENGEDVERKIAYDSRRIACKEAMLLRKEFNGLKFHFTKATNKEHKISDLEFATAALE